MIITLIFVAIVVIGIALVIKGKYDDMGTAGCIIAAVGCFCVFFCLFIVLFQHIGISTIIAENNIQYEALCERQELIGSQYEDVSRSDIIKDVAEWNIKVRHYQYWAYNPWTSWFYSREVADNMKLIERSGE